MEVQTNEDGSGIAHCARRLVRQPGWHAGKVEKRTVFIHERRCLRIQESL